MGYYSDVVIKCQENAFKKFKERFNQNNSGDMKFPDRVTMNDEGEYIIYFDQVKWYGSFPEVEAVEDVIRELNEEHIVEGDEPDGLGYHFIRVGEESGDIEDYDNDYSLDLYTVTKIVTSFSNINTETTVDF